MIALRVLGSFSGLKHGMDRYKSLVLDTTSKQDVAIYESIFGSFSKYVIWINRWGRKLILTFNFNKFLFDFGVLAGNEAASEVVIENVNEEDEFIKYISQVKEMMDVKDQLKTKKLDYADVIKLFSEYNVYDCLLFRIGNKHYTVIPEEHYEIKEIDIDVNDAIKDGVYLDIYNLSINVADKPKNSLVIVNNDLKPFPLLLEYDYVTAKKL